jgi:hypothetical protein
MTLEAEFAECFGNGIIPSAVDMNGCRYVFHVLNSAAPYVGSAAISCSSGGGIQADMFATGCHVEVPTQSGLSGVTFANVGTGSTGQVKVTFDLKGVKYSQNKKCAEGAGTFTDGAYRGVVTVGAVN